MRKILLYLSFVVTGIVSSYLTILIVYSSFVENLVDKHEASLELLSNSFLMQFQSQKSFTSLNLLFVVEDVKAVENGDMQSFYQNTCKKLNYYLSIETEALNLISAKESYLEAKSLYEELNASGFCNS